MKRIATPWKEIKTHTGTGSKIARWVKSLLERDDYSDSVLALVGKGGGSWCEASAPTVELLLSKQAEAEHADASASTTMRAPGQQEDPEYDGKAGGQPSAVVPKKRKKGAKPTDSEQLVAGYSGMGMQLLKDEEWGGLKGKGQKTGVNDFWGVNKAGGENATYREMCDGLKPSKDGSKPHDVDEYQQRLLPALARSIVPVSAGYGLPAAGANRLRWLGLEAPGPLEKSYKELGGQPIWLACRRRDISLPGSLNGVLR